MREKAGISAGDDVDVNVELDTEPREVAVPPDLAEALYRDADARSYFDGLSRSKKRWLVDPIEQAKTAETRQRRIDKALGELPESLTWGPTTRIEGTEGGDMNSGSKAQGRRDRQEEDAPRVVDLFDQVRGDDPGEFQGYHLGARFAFIVVYASPGGGPKLHRHPYEEVFLVQEGNATFTAGGDAIEASASQVVVVPGGVAHKFVNSGSGRPRQVDVHAIERFVAEWLED